MASNSQKSVAIIGAGAAGAITTAAFAAEGTFNVIRVFERRETPGGTWIYDQDPGKPWNIYPGQLPPTIDPSLEIPAHFPTTTSPNGQERYSTTPVYASLTTNVPEIAMSFSDQRFPYGPFVPHWVPRHYIENYFTKHQTDSYLALNTTVEQVTRIPANEKQQRERWKLTLRRYDPTRALDVWWQEEFDALILANGHYSIPFIPQVKGLEDYLKRFPTFVSHSKTYRTPDRWAKKRILIIGNSASGKDITTDLITSGKAILPIYQSRRSPSRWDGDEPPEGVVWKPIITEYQSHDNKIIFEDGSELNDIDAVIYCTGYKPSFPFWNAEANGGPLFDYDENRLTDLYQHTFSNKFPYTLGVVGLPRVLTFRSFEYQSIALARLFSGRSAKPLPPLKERKQWERERAERTKRERLKFHDIRWDEGETMEWLEYLFQLSGLPVLEGWGRCPPVLGPETRWAIEHIKKYPEPRKETNLEGLGTADWVDVAKYMLEKDSLHFI